MFFPIPKDGIDSQKLQVHHMIFIVCNFLLTSYSSQGVDPQQKCMSRPNYNCCSHHGHFPLYQGHSMYGWGCAGKNHHHCSRWQTHLSQKLNIQSICLRLLPHSIHWEKSHLLGHQATPAGWTWSDHGQPWLNHGWTMVSDHGWPWSGNVLTMVMLNGHHCRPWLTMVRQPWSDHGQLWSVPHSKIKWHGLHHGQILDVQTFKSTYLWRVNMAKPWSTMVWQCFDHGSTMVDHGQTTMVWPWSTMVSSTFKNQMTWFESWSNTWCADIQINIPLKGEHGLAMFWSWFNHGWPWSGNHGLTMVWPWSVPHSKIKWPLSGQSWSNTWCRYSNQHWPLGDEHGRTMVNHGWPWSGNIRQPWSDHGHPWSVPYSKIKWPSDQWHVVKYVMCWGIQINIPLEDEHGQTMVNHGLAMFWPWSDHSQFHIHKSLMTWWSIMSNKLPDDCRHSN